jgi:hypothetical protein
MRFIGPILMTIVVLFCGYRGGSYLYGQLNQQSGRKPVTITYKATTFGKPERVSVFTDYYRADGSVARAVYTGTDYASPRIEVTDLSAKRLFVKDSATKSFDEFPLRQVTYNQLSHSPTNCEAALASENAQCSALGGDQILGHAVQKATTFIEKDNGRMEFQLAPAFNFVPLKLSFWKGQQQGSETVAVNIVEGEPDAGVFLLPSEYKRATSSSGFLDDGQKARGVEHSFTADDAQKFDQLMDNKRKSVEHERVK